MCQSWVTKALSTVLESQGANLDWMFEDMRAAENLRPDPRFEERQSG